MSSSGSHSGSDLNYEEEMALCIALEQSKVDTGGSSRTGAAQTSELDSPDLCAARPGLHSLHRPRAVLIPRRPLLHAGSSGY